MTSLSNNHVDEDLLERLEISIINLSIVSDVFLRFDAEYYSQENLHFQKIVSNITGKTIGKLGGVLDCSAFYPSIINFYSDDRNLIPFLRVNEITGGLVSLTKNTVFLPQTVLDANSKTIASAFPGDIIIAKGGNTLAKVGLVTDEYPKYATCRDVIILRTNGLKGTNKFFLWTFLHSKYGQGLMWRAATQTGQPHLILPAILNLHIPDISSQIQNMCEELYKKSVIYKKEAYDLYSSAENLLNCELGLDTWHPSHEQISVRSFKHIIETDRIDAEYYQPKYDEIVNILKLHRTQKLGDIVTIQKSIEPGRSEYQQKGIPFYRISNFSQFGLTKPVIHLDSTKYEKTLMPKKNTILLSKDGSVCIAYKIEDNLCGITSSALLHLSINDNVCMPDYLTLVLNSTAVKMQAEQSAGGSIISHWRMDEISNVMIPIVSFEKQQEITDMVQKSFKLRHRSAQLLEASKLAVEIAIEQGEAAATVYLKNII